MNEMEYKKQLKKLYWRLSTGIWWILLLIILANLPEKFPNNKIVYSLCAYVIIITGILTIIYILKYLSTKEFAQLDKYIRHKNKDKKHPFIEKLKKLHTLKFYAITTTLIVAAWFFIIYILKVEYFTDIVFWKKIIVFIVWLATIIWIVPFIVFVGRRIEKFFKGEK